MLWNHTVLFVQLQSNSVLMNVGENGTIAAKKGNISILNKKGKYITNFKIKELWTTTK